MQSTAKYNRRHPLPVRARPLVFGTVLFLASEIMFFAALFAAYYDLRGNHPAWPPPAVHLHFGESLIGTLLLFASSVVTVLATRAMDRERIRMARAWIAIAAFAASAFVVLSLHGYALNEFSISSDAYGSLYYTMTGFHLLHVAAGIVLLLALLFGMQAPALRTVHREGAEAMTYYWHFVFIVWLGIWGTIYLIK